MRWEDKVFLSLATRLVSSEMICAGSLLSDICELFLKLVGHQSPYTGELFRCKFGCEHDRNKSLGNHRVYHYVPWEVHLFPSSSEHGITYVNTVERLFFRSMGFMPIILLFCNNRILSVSLCTFSLGDTGEHTSLDWEDQKNKLRQRSVNGPGEPLLFPFPWFPLHPFIPPSILQVE